MPGGGARGQNLVHLQNLGFLSRGLTSRISSKSSISVFSFLEVKKLDQRYPTLPCPNHHTPPNPTLTLSYPTLPYPYPYPYPTLPITTPTTTTTPTSSLPLRNRTNAHNQDSCSRATLSCNSFLAHLSRRLIGELIVYQWSVVVVVRRPSSTMLKHLLLTNRLADQSQILCGASLGRGNKILFAASGSHDQDGRHAHIW